jgi:transposase
LDIQPNLRGVFMSNRYDEWFKLQVAQQCLRDGTSLREVARQHGLDHSLVRTWRDSYRQHGVVGLRKKYTHRSAAFKLQVLETMWRDGLSRRQAGALFDIRECGAIGRWERQYHSGGLTALEPKRKGRRPMTKKPPSPPPPPDAERSQEELLKELAYLRAENAYLKKLDALIREKGAATRGKKPRPSKG